MIQIGTCDTCRHRFEADERIYCRRFPPQVFGEFTDKAGAWRSQTIYPAVLPLASCGEIDVSSWTDKLGRWFDLWIWRLCRLALGLDIGCLMADHFQPAASWRWVFTFSAGTLVGWYATRGRP